MSYLKRKFRYVTTLELNKCLKQIKLPWLVHNCAPFCWITIRYQFSIYISMSYTEHIITITITICNHNSRTPWEARACILLFHNRTLLIHACNMYCILLCWWLEGDWRPRGSTSICVYLKTSVNRLVAKMPLAEFLSLVKQILGGHTLSYRIWYKLWYAFVAQ